MCKKRKIITITVLFVLGVAVSYLQWGREIDVVGSMGTSSENFHEEHVTFTLNRLIITDKEKCAEEIIKKCRENDFASIMTQNRPPFLSSTSMCGLLMKNQTSEKMTGNSMTAGLGLSAIIGKV